MGEATKHRRLWRRYKAGYEVWIETSAFDFDAEIIQDPSPENGVVAAVADKISQPSIVTIKIAYTPDGKYIGIPRTAYRLCKKRGIKPDTVSPDTKVCSIGFCEREQKWYGWSHRAIYGFGIGSKIKRGDCAYVPVNWEDARADAIRFWDDDSHVNTTAIDAHDENGKPCFDVQWKYDDTIPNEKLRSTISGVRHYPPGEWGAGEWTAKTLDDAKQMAIDFAEGVG